MKTKKWITYTLVTLFTLVALAAVGFAGFRVGVMQSASFTNSMLPFNDHMQDFDENNKGQGNNPHNQEQNPNKPNGFGNSKDSGNQKGFDNQRGFDRGRGFGYTSGFFGPIFGLIRLVVLGVLVWLGYKLVKNSGWRLVNVNAATTTTTPPIVSEPVPDENGDEKKDQA